MLTDSYMTPTPSKMIRRMRILLISNFSVSQTCLHHHRLLSFGGKYSHPPLGTDCETGALEESLGAQGVEGSLGRQGSQKVEFALKQRQGEV